MLFLQLNLIVAEKAGNGVYLAVFFVIIIQADNNLFGRDELCAIPWSL